MTPAYRRVILKPSGLEKGRSSRLAELLAAAIARQWQLAAESAHILRPAGGLQENAYAFFIEHEPATPYAIEGLFDPSVAGDNEQQLLQLTVALFEALRVAHAGERPRPMVHGGLCPGVLLRSPDGIEKVADFGLAPAICVALGAESYLNLAVGPRTDGPQALCGTGVWEVLAREESERDDRICGFVAPEKYGTRLPASFEPGSDIIAAAFIIHLLAEHRHPYFFEAPEAYREVGTCELMGADRYNGARRPDLRGSANPGVKLWCTLMEKMLERLPANRPTAAEVVTALRPHVKPVDAAQILRRRLEEAEAFARQGAWNQVHSILEGVVGSKLAPPDVAERANALGWVADAHLRLIQARELLQTSDWLDAGQLLHALMERPALPSAIAKEVREANADFHHNLTVWQELEQIEAGLSQAAPVDLLAHKALLEELVARLDDLPPDDTLLPPIRQRKHAEQEESRRRLERAKTEMQAAIAADHTRAKEWLAHLERALEQQQWEILQGLLTKPPALQHWPKDIPERAHQIKQLFAEHLAKQRRQAVIAADHSKAQDWITPVRAAADADQWDRVKKLLDARPELTYWPEGVREEAQQLADRYREFCKRQADFEQARRWGNDLRQAVKAKKWTAAADVLARRPTLDHWPPEVLEAASALEQEVQKHLKALELERRRMEEEHRQVRAWLERGRAATKHANWEDALSILEAPPAVAHFPEEVRREADELMRVCHEGHAAALRQKLEVRRQTVLNLADGFVRDLIGHELKLFLDPAAVQTGIDAEEFTSTNPSADGCARLSVQLRDSAAPPGRAAIIVPFNYRLQPDPPRVCDDDGTLRRTLRCELAAALHELQQARLTDLVAPLRQGLFPKAKVTVPLPELAPRAVATVDLVGSGSSGGTVTAGITWDSAGLRWAYAEPAVFAREAAKVTAVAAQAVLGAKWLEGSPTLRCYRSLLGLELVPPASLGPETLRTALTLEGRLTLRPGPGANGRVLATFPVICPRVGEASVGAGGLATAELHLRKVVLDAQTSARDAQLTNLERRIERSPVTIKLTARPKRIGEPVEQIAFALKARRREPLTLTATWDPAAFTFKRSGDWEASLADLLAPPAPAPPLEIGIGRFAKPAIVAVAALAILAGAGYILPWKSLLEKRGGSIAVNPKQPGPNGVPKPGPGYTPPPPPPGGRKDNANHRDEVDPTNPPPRGENTNADASTTAVAEPERRKTEVPSTKPAVALAPGPDSWSGASDNNPPEVINTQPVEKPVEQPSTQKAVAAVEKLVQGILENPPFADFIASSGWRVEMDSEPQWLEDSSGSKNIETAKNAAAKVFFTSASPAAKTPPVQLKLDLTAAEGTVEVAFAEETQASLTELVKQRLVACQAEVLTQQKAELEDKLNADSIKGAVESPSLFQDLQHQVKLSITADRLQRRTLAVEWERSELAFSGLDKAFLDNLVLAYRTIEQINRRENAGGDWLSRGSPGKKVEEHRVPDPDKGEWTLSVAAPWAPPDTEVSLLNDDQRLLIEVRWPDDSPAMIEADFAKQILSNENRPRYWPLVEAYIMASTNGFFLQTLAVEIPDGQLSETREVTKYLKSPPRFILPELTPVAEPPPKLDTATTPPELEITFTGWWGLRLDSGIPAEDQLPGIDTKGLRSALTKELVPDAVVLSMKFVLSETAGKVQLANADEALKRFAPTVAKARALDHRLGRVKERRDLEGDLEKVSDRSKVDTDEAFSILRRIWNLKDADTNGIASFEELLSALRKDNQIALSAAERKAKEGKAPGRGIYPTVFVEYFCGQNACYAVVWSLLKWERKDDSVTHERFQVLRLGPVSGLPAPGLRIAPRGNDLGKVLFKGVFDVVQEHAKSSLGGVKSLGLLLALDEVLWQYNDPDDTLARLPFGDTVSIRVWPVMKTQSLPLADLFGFNTLEALRQGSGSEGPLRCDYLFVRALCDPRPWEPTSEERWAIATLYRAGVSVKKPGE